MVLQKRERGNMNLTDKEIKNLRAFLVETFMFTEEQTNAIDHQTPMTQELFNLIIERCSEIGTDAEQLLVRMLDEYPEFVAVYADKIFEEMGDEPQYTLSEEEWGIEKEKLYAKIRAEYGEDAI